MTAKPLSHPLDQLISSLNVEGFYILNLFQHAEDGHWQANLCRRSPLGSHYYQFGNGATAFDALTDARTKAYKERELLPKTKAAIDLTALLEQL